MPLIEWRKDFETGIAGVDHEHRELVTLINALADEVEAGADRERIQKFLGEVFARIAAHFALEESIMRKYSYDEYSAHKAEHEALLDDIREIMDSARSNYSEALSTTVGDWFINHFKSKDARLHKVLGV
jgi:hemerythrin-like metal-binding protein